MLPQDFAVRLVEAENPLGAGDAAPRKGICWFVRGFGELMVKDINRPRGYRRAGITGANLRAPNDRRAARPETI